MKRLAARVILLVSSLCGTLSLPQIVRADDWGVAALVNGASISEDAFTAELRRLERKTQAGGGSAVAALKKQALENLILREVLFQEAKRRGLHASEEEVGNEVARLQGKFTAEGDLERTLDRMGMEPELLEDQVGKGMVIQKLMDVEYGNKITVTADEIEHYYQDHLDDFKKPMRFRLSHILVKTGPGADEMKKRLARARIEEISHKVQSGEDFAKVARENSDCYSAHQGGDLGYFGRGSLSRGVEDEALSLKPGEVSGVVEDRYGYHLLKLTELEQPSVLPVSEVSDRIRKELSLQKESKALVPLLKRLRSEAKVEIMLNSD